MRISPQARDEYIASVGGSLVGTAPETGRRAEHDEYGARHPLIEMTEGDAK